ncbi:heterokaryon incompatibility protein-domain-containing protein [Fusarium acuminatum]|uniref:Heterokaryon incompatibility protein-domain-containing protein n=1 Tax=Fusarium acuminatum TaxID=5515 RepID=A0ABZ2X1P9_9HYPO
MSSNNVNLCSSCAAIDFEGLFYSHPDDLGPVGSTREVQPTLPCLGTLQEILDRAETCQFCRLVIDAHKERFKRTPSGSSEHFESENAIEARDEVEEYGLCLTFHDEPIKCYLEQRPFTLEMDYLYDSADESDVDSALGREGVGRLSLKLEPRPWISATAQPIRLQAIWPNGIPETKDANGTGRYMSWEGTGRPVESLVDLSIPRNWIRQCEEVHGGLCSKPKWLSDNDNEWPEKCRVIDVEDGRIVDLLLTMRYVALSYVWGLSEKAVELRSERRLTRDNMSRLKQHNSLDQIPIPQTIRDAMAVVKATGERYLWVDALCIVQDDPEDLSQQTGRMDLIYSKALFTIVAACGSDSESGLAGFPSSPRDIFQRQVKVSPNELHVMPCLNLSEGDTLESSKWNTRGWTFQERLLSRRALIFTNSQIYWCCEGRTWDEESLVDIPGSTIVAMAQEFGCYDEWESIEAKFSEEIYSTYITQFSTRQFTFPSDALPAFLGIIHRYEHLNKQKLHWGLRTIRFDQSLVWKYGQDRRREMYTYISKDSVACSVPYPSWSWLGWTGFIGGGDSYWLREVYEKMDNGRSILTFYVLMSDGSVSPIEQSYPDDTPRKESDEELSGEVPECSGLKWKGDTTVSGPITVGNVLLSSELEPLGMNSDETSQSQIPYDTGRLVFWTSHTRAQIYIDTDDQPHIEARGQAVELDVHLAKEAMHTRRYFPKITGAKDAEKRRNLSERNAAIPRHPVDLIVISRWFGFNDGVEVRRLNFFVVEEKVPGLGVWGRIGFGVIEEEEWDKLELDWRLVILE